MQNADFVRVQNDQVDLFDYHDVLKGIREHTSPFEFLSIKEECDYSLKTCAVGCLRTLVECAEGEMESLSMSDREAFAEVARRLLSQQELETFRFDTKYSYIQEAVTGLLLPALVKYGADHPFTSAVFAEFSKQASVYTKASEQFMDEYGEIMNQKSQSEDESTTY
jgi:hypothetical protein